MIKPTNQDHLNLECPSCGRFGVSIQPQDQKSRFGFPIYFARCGSGWGGRWKGGCGYYLGDLDSDGTQRSALREWKQILNAAAEARRILGVNLMKQQELELNVGAFIGTTDWMNSGNQPPVHVGWYDARLVMSEEERELRDPPAQRRWWFGDGWSWPVVVGEMDDELIAWLGNKRSPRELASVEYRGLLKKVV